MNSCLQTYFRVLTLELFSGRCNQNRNAVNIGLTTEYHATLELYSEAAYAINEIVNRSKSMPIDSN